MKLWDIFRSYTPSEVMNLEAFQPTDEQRECDVAARPLRLEAKDNGNAALVATRAEVAAIPDTPRATARVFLIRSPRVRLYPLALFFKSRGYRLKQDGRGYIEAVR